MNTRTLATTAFGATLVGLAVLSACQTSISAGFDGPIDPGPPPFTGADGAPPVPPPEAGLCNAYECPAPYATCPDTSGLCGANLSNDVEHCGSCDTRCPVLFGVRNPLQATFVCAKSKCQMLCRTTHGDCNGFVDDGCEVNLDDDPTNCGACGNACAAGSICWKGACGCPAGYTQCGKDCVKLSDDGANCGACGHACTEPAGDAGATTWPCGPDVKPTNTAFDCAVSTCGLHCAPGYGNCNSNVCGDGCESSLGEDPKNCGACGHACTADQICIEGKCICDPDQTRCGTTCADLQTDPLNCGACGNACPGLTGNGINGHGNPVCVLGRCDYQCGPGFADCDHRIENGCEIDLNVDPLHCGGCGTHCDLKGNQPCAAGHCLTKPCDAGVVL